MKKIIYVILLSLVCFGLSFSQPAAAPAGEEEHVVIVDHSRDHLKKKVYTRAQLEAERQKKLEWKKRDLETDRLRREVEKVSASNDIAEISAVSISAQGSTFNDMADAFGDFMLMGEVKNTGSTTGIFVEITVRMYDSGNSLIDTDSTYIKGGSVVKLSSGSYTRGLRSGQTGFFKIYTSVPYSNVDHYTYTFSYDTGFSAYAKATLQFKSTPTTSADYFGDLEIVGEIENTSSTHLTYFTEVYFSVKNSSGKVLDVASRYVDGSVYDTGIVTTDTAIQPGEDASFDCSTNAPFNQYSTYNYAFEWDEVQVAFTTTYTLTVQSSPDTGAGITVSPNDNSSNGNGTTNFTRTYDKGTEVTLTAPSTYNNKNFSKWTIDGADNTSRTINVTMNSNHTVAAVYESAQQTPTYTLTVKSSPSSGAGITVSPDDNSGDGNGTTTFTRTYDENTEVSLTAPSSYGSSFFSKWTVDGSDFTSQTIAVTMDGNHTATAVYTSTPPEISLNRTELYFCYISGGSMPQTQSFIISNSGGGSLDWSIDDGWDLDCEPDSGTGSAIVTVTLDPTGLSAGYYSGVLEITAPGASNSPQNVTAYLEVKSASQDQDPFGDFSTPVDNSTARSSIPVTGWVLDDTGVKNVKIYRELGGGLVYIGDAVFVEGARPDIEAAYPGYPSNYKAGWGYMMLSNFLPNGGNGTYKLYAIATDTEGNSVTLGTKTITCDNANAVKPFGAIDTPTQGGKASGSSFINWGWVLTPQPNSMPTDGSTINVFVDGVNIGHPNYNVYRADIAGLFPGYANSNGAIGYFFLDTTAYENGVHTIQWTARDSGGNSDGIGSRYFTIDNSGSSDASNQGQPHRSSGPGASLLQTMDGPVPVLRNPGWKKNVDTEIIRRIRIKELERIQIDLSDLEHNNSLKGYLLVDGRSMRLPIGSNLDRRKGIFSWLPGPAFLGQYHLVFVAEGPNGQLKKKDMIVEIVPATETH